MSQPPPLLLVLDARDDAAVTRAALAEHDPHAGLVTVHPSPGTGSTTVLAHDVLAALGKPPTRFACEGLRREASAWSAALAWIIGEQIRQIAVLRTHLFTTRQWQRLAQLHADSGAVVIAYCHAPRIPAAARPVLEAIEYRVVSRVAEAADILSAWQVSLPARDGDGDEHQPPPEPLPAVPHSEVAHFRADCAREMPPGQFALLDAQYTAGLHAACAWITEQPQYKQAIEPPEPPCIFLPPHLPPEESQAAREILENYYDRDTFRQLGRGLLCVGRRAHSSNGPYAYPWSELYPLRVFLARLVASCDAPTALTRLRGAQAGFLLHGHLLALPAALHTRIGPGVNTVRLTAERVARLRTRLAHPAHAAALAAAMITGADPAQLHGASPDMMDARADTLQLTVPAAIHESGRHAAERCLYAIPALARGIFRAALAYHRMDPARADSGFLAHGIGTDLEQLRASARACRIDLPALVVAHPDISAWPRTASWNQLAACWSVHDPVHGPEVHNPNAGHVS